MKSPLEISVQHAALARRRAEWLLLASPLLPLLLFALVTRWKAPRLPVLEPQSTLKGGGVQATALAFSPDGQLLAVGAWDGTVTLWNLATAKVQATLTAPRGITSLAFSPDSERLVGWSEDGTGRLWKVRSGAVLRMLALRDCVTASAFSPDGRLLWTGGNSFSTDSYQSEGNTVRCWDGTTGVLKRQMHLGVQGVMSVAFAADGSRAATGSQTDTQTEDFSAEVRLWDMASGKRMHRMGEPIGTVSALAFSPDGKMLASGTGWSVRLWNVQTGALIHSLERLSGPVMGLAFSPNGRLLAADCRKSQTSHSWTGEVRLWEVGTWRALGCMPTPGDFSTPRRVAALAFSVDSRTLAGAGWDSAVRLWNVDDLSRDQGNLR